MAREIGGFMRTVLVTGAAGFVGKNLVAALQRRDDVRLLQFDVQDAPATLKSALAEADVIYHLAGVNRPTDEREFVSGNTGLTEQIVSILEGLGRSPRIIMTSSIQAELDNPYGRSKLGPKRY